MMEIENNIKAIVEHLENECTQNELMSLHNAQCERNNDMDSQIFNNDEDFFTTFFDGRQQELIRAMQYGEHKINDDFVKFNGYANLESFDDVSEEIDINEIATAILEEPEHFDVELLESDEDEAERIADEIEDLLS